MSVGVFACGIVAADTRGGRRALRPLACHRLLVLVLVLPAVQVFRCRPHCRVVAQLLVGVRSELALGVRLVKTVTQAALYGSFAFTELSRIVYLCRRSALSFLFIALIMYYF
jgi:hypothetical protein